jgi:quinolinate synthase
VGAYPLLRRYGVTAPHQQKIPREYFKMAGPERDEKIWALKRQLGKDLVVLGHHYQRDEVIQFADFRGDSFKLSQQAAGRADAEFILFCGVHFMAESADILSQPHQKVILPNLEAGCSMADRRVGYPGEARRHQRRAHHLHELGRGAQGVLR